MHFGATLRLLRTDAGISLRALANEVGVSSAYLSRVENGHDAVPTPDRLVAIARALRLPPALLIELAHKATPFVASYLERVPAAGALFLEIARRDLTAAQLGRIKAFIDAEFPAEAPQGALTIPRLTSLLTPERVVPRLSCSHLEDTIDVAVSRLASAQSVPSPADLAQAILAREREAPSALGEGLAVPHAVVPRSPPRAALVTLAQPLAAPTPDGRPLRVVVVLVLEHRGEMQLHLLAQAARLASADVVDSLASVADGTQALRYLTAHGF